MRHLLLYALVLLAFYLLVRSRSQAPVPVLSPPAGELNEADLGVGKLAPPSRRDALITIRSTIKTSSSGTAFALGGGYWLSARHVVDGCSSLMLLAGNQSWGAVRMRGQAVSSKTSDLALVQTKRTSPAFSFAEPKDIRQNQSGFLVGFPQGRVGEVQAKLLGRGRAVFSKRHSNSEPVLVWVETGRREGVKGTLGGISGGPIFDARGRVIGVIIAESLRRGRVYTAAPASIRRSLAIWGLNAQSADPAGVFTSDNYILQGDYLRQAGRVVKVLCKVDP